MVSGAPYREGRFIQAGQGFPSVLLSSKVLRWMMPGMVVGDIAKQRRLYLVSKTSHVGVDVDGLAYPLYHPMVCSHQTRG
jgi:hypothetical protein